MPMDATLAGQIEAQMAQNFALSNKRLDLIAEQGAHAAQFIQEEAEVGFLGARGQLAAKAIQVLGTDGLAQQILQQRSTAGQPA